MWFAYMYVSRCLHIDSIIVPLENARLQQHLQQGLETEHQNKRQHSDTLSGTHQHALMIPTAIPVRPLSDNICWGSCRVIESLIWGR